VQSRGGEVIEMHPGDAAAHRPGSGPLHAAAQTTSMTHIAMWGAPAEGPETCRGDQVSGPEYGARAK
jgi:hypothetical protein